MDFATYKLIYDMAARLEAVETTVNKIWALVQTEQEEELKLMATAQEVVAKVAEVQGAEQSTIALLDEVHAMLVDVKAQLQANAVDTAALDNVITTLDGSKSALAEAVARNPLPA